MPEDSLIFWCQVNQQERLSTKGRCVKLPNYKKELKTMATNKKPANYVETTAKYILHALREEAALVGRVSRFHGNENDGTFFPKAEKVAAYNQLLLNINEAVQSVTTVSTATRNMQMSESTQLGSGK